MANYDTLAKAFKIALKPEIENISDTVNPLSSGGKTELSNFAPPGTIIKLRHNEKPFDGVSEKNQVISPAPIRLNGNMFDRLIYRPVQKRTGEDQISELPVINRIGEQLLYDDRFKPFQKWYLPSFKINPANNVFFSVSKIGRNSRDQELFNVRMELIYQEVESADFLKAKEKLQKTNSAFIFKKIPVKIEQIGLQVAYGTKDQPVQSPVLYAKAVSGNLMTFDLSDNEDITYARLVYNNLSNFHQDSSGLAFTFTVSFSCWDNHHPLKLMIIKPMVRRHMLTEINTAGRPINPISVPVLRTGNLSDGQNNQEQSVPEKVSWYKRNINKFEIKVSESFPCSLTKGYVHQPDAGPLVTFGCNPPWSEPYINGKFYQRYELPEKLSDVPVSLFQQIAQPSTFLIIPEQYCLSLDDQEFSANIPGDSTVDVILTSMINANPGYEMENQLRLDMIVSPFITSLEIELLKQTIMEDTKLYPELRFPAELGISPVIDVEQNKNEGYELVPGSHNLRVGFQSKEGKFPQSLLNLSLLKSSQTMGISLPVSFNIDSENKQGSVINLHLGKTVGNIVQIRINDVFTELIISNLANGKVAVAALLFYNAGQKGFDYFVLPSALEIEAQKETVVQIDPQWLSSGETKYTSCAAQYNFIEDDSQLTELRINLDLQWVLIPVSVEMNAALHQITSLSVSIHADFLNQISIEDQYLVKKVVPKDGSFEAGDEKPFKLTYPLAIDLQPEQKVLTYTVTVEFADKPSFVSGAIIHNFYSNPRILITQDILNQ